MDTEPKPLIPQTPTEQPAQPVRTEPSPLITQDEIQNTAAAIKAEKKEEPEYPTVGGRIATYFLVLLAIIAVATVTIALIVSAS